MSAGLVVKAKGRYLDDLPALLGIPSVDLSELGYKRAVAHVSLPLTDIARVEFREVEVVTLGLIGGENPAERAPAGLAGALLKRELDRMADDRGVIAYDSIDLAVKTLLAAVRAGVNPFKVNLSFYVESPRESVRYELEGPGVDVLSFLSHILAGVSNLFDDVYNGRFHPLSGESSLHVRDYLRITASKLRKLATRKPDRALVELLVRPVAENMYLAALAAHETLGLKRVVDALAEAEATARHPMVKHAIQTLRDAYTRFLGKLSEIRRQAHELYWMLEDDDCCEPETYTNTLREMAQTLDRITALLSDLYDIAEEANQKILAIDEKLRFGPIFAKG